MKTQIARVMFLLVFSLVVFCFANAVLADTAHDHEHKLEFSLFSLVRPLGVCALVSVLVTFITGLFRRKIGRRFLKIHKTFAFLTIAFALCHGILVMILF